jgi:hypothetical protein
MPAQIDPEAYYGFAHACRFFPSPQRKGGPVHKDTLLRWCRQRRIKITVRRYPTGHRRRFLKGSQILSLMTWALPGPDLPEDFETPAQREKRWRETVKMCERLGI